MKILEFRKLKYYQFIFSLTRSKNLVRRASELCKLHHQKFDFWDHDPPFFRNVTKSKNSQSQMVRLENYNLTPLDSQNPLEPCYHNPNNPPSSTGSLAKNKKTVRSIWPQIDLPFFPFEAQLLERVAVQDTEGGKEIDKPTHFTKQIQKRYENVISPDNKKTEKKIWKKSRPEPLKYRN